MPSLRHLLSATAVAAVLACGDSTGPNDGVTVATSAASYPVNSTVTYTITNPLIVAVVYGVCPRIERKTESTYQLVPADEPCAADAVALNARRAVTLTVPLPSAAAAGTYRLGVLLTTDDGNEVVYSPDFSVTN